MSDNNHVRNSPSRDEVVDNLLSWKSWLRILLALIAGGILSWGLVVFILLPLSFIQALFVLITGKDNERLRRLGVLLAMYQAQISLYMTWGSNRTPFPLNDAALCPDDLDVRPDEEVVTADIPAREAPAAPPAPQPTAAAAPTAAPDADFPERPSDTGDDDVFSDMSFTSTGPRPADDVSNEAHEADDIEPGDDETPDDTDDPDSRQDPTRP